ncbi:MAG: glycosyl transferase family 2, partial [Anaeromyxobacteraceae bacterium]|nr:glycosyl transferase family 2 [Anaeromyxobacteraceae bacterium]
GWRAATTPLVQFVDSDTELEPGWLALATRAIAADDRIACLFGQLHESNPSGSRYNEVCGCDWWIPPGDWRMCGGNALFRLAALREVDGSDEALAAGEEADLCWRLRRRGWRIVCHEAVQGHHDLGMTGFRDYWRRAVRSGRAYAEVGLRFARTSDPLWRRELVRNLVGPPAALLLALLAGWWLGAAGLGALGLLVAARLAWKVRALRGRLPALGLRLRYVAHLAFVRLPLFVGSVGHLWGRLGARRGR